MPDLDADKLRLLSMLTRARFLTAQLEYLTASLNADVSKYGEPRCDYDEMRRQVVAELEALLGELP